MQKLGSGKYGLVVTKLARQLQFNPQNHMLAVLPPKWLLVQFVRRRFGGQL
jgi:hypothetical protein